MDLQAMILINLALVLYSIGVWGERLQGNLFRWHLVLFYLGLICDTLGTGIMFDMAGGMTFDVHGISGLVAIILMLIHALWATGVLIQNDTGKRQRFHRFSVVVWLIWLLPYFSPMFFALATPAHAW